jgi:hypothetical protein
MGTGGEHPKRRIAAALVAAASVVAAIIAIGSYVAPHIYLHPLGRGGIVGLVAMTMAILVVVMLSWMRRECVRRGGEAQQHWAEIRIYAAGLLAVGVIAVTLSSLVLTNGPAPSVVILLPIPLGVVALIVWFAFKQMAEDLSAPSADHGIPQGNGLVRIVSVGVVGIVVVAMLAAQHPRISPRSTKVVFVHTPPSTVAPSHPVPPRGPAVPTDPSTTTTAPSRPCGTLLDIEGQIEGAVPGQVGVNIYAAWYAQGTKVLGCDFGASYAEGSFTVLPVSGGTDGSDSLIANASEGVVGFSDFGGELLQNLPKLLKVMDRVRWGFGTAQLAVFNDGSCSLLDEYGASTTWVVPQSVTALIVPAALLAKGFPKIVSGPATGASGTFEVDIYAADSSIEGGSAVAHLSVAYDSSSDSATVDGHGEVSDSASCPIGISKLPGFAKTLEESVDVATNNPNPYNWSPSWALVNP